MEQESGGGGGGGYGDIISLWYHGSRLVPTLQSLQRHQTINLYNSI